MQVSSNSEAWIDSMADGNVSMSKRGMKAGGCLVIIGAISTVMYAGGYRLVTGHLPGDLSYWIVGTIGLSIAADIYGDLHEAIDESVTEIKDQLKSTEKRIVEALKRSDEGD